MCLGCNASHCESNGHFYFSQIEFEEVGDAFKKVGEFVAADQQNTLSASALTSKTGQGRFTGQMSGKSYAKVGLILTCRVLTIRAAT